MGKLLSAIPPYDLDDGLEGIGIKADADAAKAKKAAPVIALVLRPLLLVLFT